MNMIIDISKSKQMYKFENYILKARDNGNFTIDE